MDYDWSGTRTRRVHHFKIGLIFFAAATLLAIPLLITIG